MKSVFVLIDRHESPLTILTYRVKKGVVTFDDLHRNATLLAEQQALYQQGKGFLTYAQAIVSYQPLQKFLSADDLKVANQLLSKKPDGIPTSQFNLIKSYVQQQVPFAEFIQVGLIPRVNIIVFTID